MRLVLRLPNLRGRDFGNERVRGQYGRKQDSNHRVKGSGQECPLHTLNYSSTLSSSFFLPQSAAAWTKASTTGCGFFSVDDSCGWNRVARKKRWVGDSMARISRCAPRATTGNPASMVVHS